MLNKHPMAKAWILFAGKATYVVAMILLVIFLGIVLGTAAVDTINRPRTFTVAGEASRYVKPDTANLVLSTVVRDETARKVQEKASQIMTDAVDAIKALGLEEKEIQTSSYNVSPEYKYVEATGEQEIYAYSTTITLTIKTQKVDKVSDVLDAATSKGVNSVNSFSFSIEDVEKVQEELKLEAIADAKRKAKDMASEAGLKLGKVLNVYDSYSQPYYEYSDYKMAPSQMVGNAELAMDEESARVSVPIAQGEEEITATVTLEYQVK